MIKRRNLRSRNSSRILYESIIRDVAKKVKRHLNEWDDYDFPEDDDDDDYYDEPQKYTLVGIDGNAFSVMGYVSQCMKKEHMSREDIENYRKDAMSGDYNNLLAVSQEMIDFLNEQ